MMDAPLTTSENGFTLVELLVGLLLSVIIFGAITALFTRKSGVEIGGQHIGSLHEAGTLAMGTMIDAIKQADKDPSKPYPMYLTISGKTLSIVNANAADTFSFTLVSTKLTDTTGTNILPSWGGGAIEVVIGESAFYGCDTSGTCTTASGTEFDLIRVVLSLKNTATGATQKFETKIGLTK